MFLSFGMFFFVVTLLRTVEDCLVYMGRHERKTKKKKKGKYPDILTLVMNAPYMYEERRDNFSPRGSVYHMIYQALPGDLSALLLF